MIFIIIGILAGGYFTAIFSIRGMFYERYSIYIPDGSIKHEYNLDAR